MRHSWQPNKFQCAVLLTYGGGDIAYLGDEGSGDQPDWADEGEFDEYIEEHVGDTLVLYLMRELSDVEDNDEAVRRIRQSIGDLEQILPAVTLI